MNVVLENVNQKHLAVLKELAKALNFTISEVSKETFPKKELLRRIHHIENEGELITPDWEAIQQQADTIK